MRIDWPWAKAPTRTLPDDERVYAVGDVHGRDDLLGELHAAIRNDIACSPRVGRVVVVHLGDYVDRGPDSRAVVERLCLPPPAGVDEVVNLRGNHEALLGDFLNGADVGRAWLQIGGDTTLASYGVGMTPAVAPERRFDAMRDALNAAMPRAHREWLANLALFHRRGGYLFVHAGVRPGRRWERQRPEDLMWIRDRFLASRADHGAIVVHGHHCTATPDERANRIGIDTGAYFSGVLTCLVLEGDRRRFLDTGSAA